MKKQHLRLTETDQELEKQVLAIIREREEKAIKINWQFSIETARTKLNRHYKEVNAKNEKYRKI